MLKSFIQKNLYFILGCLLIVILVALGIQSMNRQVEGLVGSEFKETSYTLSTCISSWTPVVPSESGFYFKNNNYKPIYVLSSPNDTINNLFQNNKVFNVDCSNVLYSRNSNKTFNKYTYNNNTVLYDNTSVGSFYGCFMKLINDTKPIIYYRYKSYDKTPFIKIVFSYDGTKNIKNTFNIKLNLSDKGKETLDKVFLNYLIQTHKVYSTDIVSGFLLSLNKTDPVNVKYNAIIYKKDGTKDILTNLPKIVEDSTLLEILKKPEMNKEVISIYDARNTSAKYNLGSSTQTKSYVYGRINYGNEYCYSISNI
jgi:hypothetical protein